MEEETKPTSVNTTEDPHKETTDANVVPGEVDISSIKQIPTETKHEESRSTELEVDNPPPKEDLITTIVGNLDEHPQTTEMAKTEDVNEDCKVVEGIDFKAPRSIADRYVENSTSEDEDDDIQNFLDNTVIQIPEMNSTFTGGTEMKEKDDTNKQTSPTDMIQGDIDPEITISPSIITAQNQQDRKTTISFKNCVEVQGAKIRQ